MQIKRLLFPGLALSAMLGITAFGSDGIKNLLTTRINPAEAAVPAAGQPGRLTLVGGLTIPISATVSMSAIEFVPAPELPNRPPEAAGIFSSRDSNTLTLQSTFAQIITGTQGSATFDAAGLAIAPGAAAPAGTFVVSGSAVSSSAITAQGAPAEIQAGAGTVELHSATVIGQGELAPVSAEQAVPAGIGSTIVVGPGLPAQTEPQKVAVTAATKIYHDVTPLGQPPADGQQTVRQTLEAGSLAGLTEKTVVTVWGHQEAGQLTADVIVYQSQFTN